MTRTSQRFALPIRITMHAEIRMDERGISEAMLLEWVKFSREEPAC